MTTIAQSTDTPSRLVAKNLTLGYGDRIIVDELDLEIPTGVITTVIGPNGCGKSTLLRALGRLLKPKGGSVVLDGKAISSMKTKEVARVLGILPQTPVAPEGLTVADLVSRGRHPHQLSWIRQWSGGRRGRGRGGAEALELTGASSDLADRPVDRIVAGGQRQRAWISMALAQGTDIFCLPNDPIYPIWTSRTRWKSSTWWINSTRKWGAPW